MSDLARLILLALKASIFLTVFGFALTATVDEATSLLRSPRKLLRALISMNVVMFVVAVLLIAMFDLHPAVKIALAALAVSPVPPMLPRKIFKAGGARAYTIGLLAAAAALSIVLIPLSLDLLQRIFGVPIGLSPSAVAVVVLQTVLAPLAAGILVHAVRPQMANTLAKPVSGVAAIVLIASALPILITQWPAMRSLIGNGTVVALAAFAAIGAAAGQVLGGPDPEERMILALSTASRHPGVAIAVARASFPEQKLAMAAVALYLVVGPLVTMPYMRWWHRRMPA